MWDPAGFMKDDPQDDMTDGPGMARRRLGVTGLATLAFLAGNKPGRRPANEDPYADNIRRALRYLETQQDELGRFRIQDNPTWLRDHAIVTAALCEAHRLEPRQDIGDALRPGLAQPPPAQRALDYIAQARNGRAGWGSDRATKTETTVWCVLALMTGKLAGLKVDADAFEGARVWLVRDDAVRTNADAGGALLGRIFLGERSAKSKGVIQLAERCLKHLPVWDTEDGSIDMHYWHFGTLGMFQVGGSRWRKWDKAMKVAVVKNQFPRGSGSRTGSWDPMGRGGTERGRVGSTALMVLTLEVYYRYDRVFGRWN